MFANTLYRESFKLQNITNSINGYEYDGLITVLQAGENLSSGDVCFFNTDEINSDNNSKMFKSYSLLFDKYPLICLQNLTKDQSGYFFVYGYIKNSSWNWYPYSGLNLFLESFENRGQMKQDHDINNESFNHIYMTLGKVLSSNQIYFSPDIYFFSGINFKRLIETPKLLTGDDTFCSGIASNFVLSEFRAKNFRVTNNVTFKVVWQKCKLPTFLNTDPSFKEEIDTTSCIYDTGSGFSTVCPFLDSDFEEGEEYFIRVKYIGVT